MNAATALVLVWIGAGIADPTAGIDAREAPTCSALEQVFVEARGPDGELLSIFPQIPRWPNVEDPLEAPGRGFFYTKEKEIRRWGMFFPLRTYDVVDCRLDLLEAYPKAVQIIHNGYVAELQEEHIHQLRDAQGFGWGELIGAGGIGAAVAAVLIAIL